MIPHLPRASVYRLGNEWSTVVSRESPPPTGVCHWDAASPAPLCGHVTRVWPMGCESDCCVLPLRCVLKGSGSSLSHLSCPHCPSWGHAGQAWPAVSDHEDRVVRVEPREEGPWIPHDGVALDCLPLERSAERTEPRTGRSAPIWRLCHLQRNQTLMDSRPALRQGPCKGLDCEDRQDREFLPPAACHLVRAVARPKCPCPQVRGREREPPQSGRE